MSRDLPYLAQVAFWRVVYRQLYWPKNLLHVAAEQEPRRDNRITLSGEPAAFGLPLAAIDWHVRDEDYAVFAAFIRRFVQFWQRHQLDAIGELEWLARPNQIASDLAGGGGDIFHSDGTTRMGVDGRTAVVDRHLTTFAVPNLSVASTSIFPNGASANPTLMLFALRLGDHLGRTVRAA